MNFEDELSVLYPDMDPDVMKLYVKYASEFLKSYLNNDDFSVEYIQRTYRFVIIQMVGNAWKSKISGGGGNIKSMTQGNRSVSFGDGATFAITDDIARMLPYPYVKMY